MGGREEGERGEGGMGDCVKDGGTGGKSGPNNSGLEVCVVAT